MCISLYVSVSGSGTHSKLPGPKPPLKDSEVVDEQAATEGVFDIETDQSTAKEPPNLHMQCNLKS